MNGPFERCGSTSTRLCRPPGRSPSLTAVNHIRRLSAEPQIATRPDRILALDVLRGIAILGTLASNIWIFTGGVGGATDSWDDNGTDWFAAISSWLPNGKFLGLLTIMFGIGLEIQRQAALRAGRTWPGKYPWRAMLLFVDGLLNYIFVVTFDVLRAYALIGLLVAFLLLTSERMQWWLVGAFLGAHVSWMAWVAFQAPSELLRRPGVARALRGGAEGGDPRVLDQGPITAVGGDESYSYWDTVVSNFQNTLVDLGPGSEFFTLLFMGPGLFLLGALLYRNGVFAPRRRRLRAALMILGFGIALPLDFALANEILPGGFGHLGRYGAAAVVSLGILAAVGEFVGRRGRVGRPGRLLSVVGRMALSCYLLQNILGVLAQSLIFPLPVFQTIHPVWGSWLAFLVISAILVVFSWLWLRWFSRGPAELLWNWSYRKLARE
jgi:uncharacterized protein